VEPSKQTPGAPQEREALARVVRRIAKNVSLAVQVREDTLEHVLVALLAEGHVLVEDYPGVGKTALARALARSVDCHFARVQCTSDLLPADVVGTNVYDQREQHFEFRPGPVFAFGTANAAAYGSTASDTGRARAGDGSLRPTPLAWDDPGRARAPLPLLPGRAGLHSGLARFADAADMPSPAQRRALRIGLRVGLGIGGQLRSLWALPPRLILPRAVWQPRPRGIHSP